MHFTIIALFILLAISILGWWLLHRRFGHQHTADHPHFRLYRALPGLIATLAILVTLLIVFSSDPGDPDDYLWWP
jgi:hypothetical protein